jgi:hypothetical protein
MEKNGKLRMENYTQWGKSAQRLLKTNHNGTLRIQEVTEVSAKLCKSAGTPVDFAPRKWCFFAIKQMENWDRIAPTIIGI